MELFLIVFKPHLSGATHFYVRKNLYVALIEKRDNSTEVSSACRRGARIYRKRGKFWWNSPSRGEAGESSIFRCLDTLKWLVPDDIIFIFTAVFSALSFLLDTVNETSSCCLCPCLWCSPASPDKMISSGSVKTLSLDDSLLGGVGMSDTVRFVFARRQESVTRSGGPVVGNGKAPSFGISPDSFDNEESAASSMIDELFVSSIPSGNLSVSTGILADKSVAISSGPISESSCSFCASWPSS